MARSGIDELEQAVAADGKKIERDVRQILFSGLALTVPFFITVLVLAWMWNVVSNGLAPLVAFLNALGLVEGTSTLLVEAIAASLILGVVFVVGLVAQHGPDTHIAHRVDMLMEDIPGLGSVYTSIERMSDVLLEGDTQSFQEVKIVEFPTEESFALAFLTAETPTAITDAADHEEMSTVFVPMAPNPVMGGHLLNLPRDRIYDVDLSVEEGMEAIMTTGIAIDEHARDTSS
jgi:uncharacterized membrane protein